MTDNTSIPVLIVTMGTDYVAPARMPRELKAAGFSVAMLAPREALATQTRFVDKLGFFPERPTVFDWLQTLASAVQAVRPKFLFPGDDITVRLLMQLVVAPLPALRAEVQKELADLVVASLGDPRHYGTSIDKTLLVDAARALGVPVPPGEGVDDESGAVRVAEALGFPVIVRPAIGTEGVGVARCDDMGALRAAMRALPQPTGWIPAGGRRALVQRFVTGRPANRPSVAFGGHDVAGVTRWKMESYLSAFGPGSVSRYLFSPVTAESSRRLTEGLGMSGFLSIQYLVDKETGETYLIEINRRMTPATHTCAQLGVDLAVAFAVASAGGVWSGPTDVAPDTDRVLALFPQEWLRDPSSRHLEQCPTDAPWDDPRLFTAMLKLGYGQAPRPEMPAAPT